MTIQVDAMFKNGTTPTTNRDFQRLFTGVLRRSFEIEDIKVLRMSMARNDKRQLCGLFDLGRTDPSFSRITDDDDDDDDDDSNTKLKRKKKL